ncbi:MAG: endolytic transglycosylase MltG, partial [Pseudomonadota bacterium]
TYVNIKSGSTVRDIALLLEQRFVIDDIDSFLLTTRLFADDGIFKAGEYKFAAKSSIVDIISGITSGQNLLHYFTVFEGEPSYRVIERLAETPCLIGEVPLFIADGSLLADTHGFFCGNSYADLVSHIQNKQQQVLNNLWQQYGHNSANINSASEALILASIVEAESSTFDEQPIIASVYLNRLAKKMRLQADPTVIYAITEGKHKLDRPLTYQDLKYDSPFNTYVNSGLPPGPIANVSSRAITATLNPEATDYLFFVANGKRHIFSKNYKQHKKNIQTIRAQAAINLKKSKS